MKDALILFTRVPIPGQTKTRLMPFLTGEECARLHACFVKDIYEKAKQVDADIFVFFTPKDEKKLLQQVLDNETVCLPQFGDDLGERMKNAIGIVLRMGYEKVILIGTDIPQIHPETLKNAFDNLGGKDIVIHPTFDGGYYLIGMKKEYDSIWKIERYGTNTVIYDTLQHMRNEKLSTAVGQMYYDVDDKGDLYHLYEDIEKGAICNCPITIDYLELGLKGKLDKIMNKWDLDACIHCGKCTRSCLFLEKYGIDLPVLKEKPELAYHCFLCGTCGCVCPKGIDGKEIALDSRRKLVEDGGGKLLDNSYDGLLLEKNPYKFANYRHSKKKAVFFTGCNFPSFFPKTTDKLVEEFAKYDVGVVYDCCGKPIEELGLVSEAAGIIERINWKLKESGVEQVIMACPNCYYFLKGRLDAEIISVYEKMAELKIGNIYQKERIPMYYPCPDRKDRKFEYDMKPFLVGKVEDAFRDVQCCGLGGCAAGKEADVAQALTDRVKASREPELYTYCASCICSFRRRGYEDAKHLLPLIMGIDEKVPLGKTPILNRAKCKFK